jgi:hypothetical protein
MKSGRVLPVVLGMGAMLGVCPVDALAHSGPPFPIVMDRVAGPYEISIWTDPDSTDDGPAAGQFWIVVHSAGTGAAVPSDTRANISITPLDRPGPRRAVRTEPVNGDVSRQFAAVVLDHEGRFDVRVEVDGPLGSSAVEAQVDATYDLRPRPILIVVYLMPFVLVGFLWLKLLVRRSHTTRTTP